MFKNQTGLEPVVELEKLYQVIHTFNKLGLGV